MSYLVRFNESISKEIYNTLISDCEYILSELVDNKNSVVVTIDNSYRCLPSLMCKSKKRYLFIDIDSDNSNYIKLNEYEEEFNQLLSYLSSNGYKLRTDSYVTNDSWDPIEKCPECGYENTMINPKIKFYDETGECGNCDRESDMEYFLLYSHNISESDINYFIKHKYWVEEMHLIFEEK